PVFAAPRARASFRQVSATTLLHCQSHPWLGPVTNRAIVGALPPSSEECAMAHTTDKSPDATKTNIGTCVSHKGGQQMCCGSGCWQLSRCCSDYGLGSGRPADTPRLLTCLCLLRMRLSASCMALK